MTDPEPTGYSHKRLGSSRTALRACSALWKSPTVKEAACAIEDGEHRLEVSDVKRPPSSAEESPDATFGKAYIVTLSGTFDRVEPLRQHLVKYAEEQGFKPVYVLKDEVSKEIACQLYPHLYQIENALRGYLIKFMTTRVGAGWWDVTVSREIAEKAKERRRNEVDFGRHLERDTYLIDFGDLGKIIYEWSSG